MAIPIEYSRFQSPEGYQGALGDVNAQWLLKVLKGAPGAVQPQEQALIERLRKDYATPSGGLNLPADILDVIRKSAGGTPAASDAERMSAVQMPSWSPVGGVTGGPAPGAAPVGATPSIRKYVSAKDSFAQMRSNPNMPVPTLGVSPLQNPVKKYQSPNPVMTQSAIKPATSPFRPDWMNQANELLGTTASPAGNNIAANTATPVTTPTPETPLSGTAMSTVTPNPSTTSQDIFVNPAAGVNRRKQGANKYFNRQWFGGKQLA